MELISPEELKRKYPAPSTSFLTNARDASKNILLRRDPRLAAIVGPCSIHDPKSALEFAKNLKELTPEIEHSLFPIMRFFFAKPRTIIGWKGMIHDPHLDGSNDINAGLEKTRRLLIEITELGIPCASELLDPLSVPYFDDLLTWGLIGARTSASQPHREIGSNLNFPIGFKNDCNGLLDEAISAIISAKTPHRYLGINEKGKVTAIQTKGNPYAHLVLRGGVQGPNYDTCSIEKAIEELTINHINTALLIDCSHGNSNKDHLKQPHILKTVLEHASKNNKIAGFMLESHLFEGKQNLGEDPSQLQFGVSITDSCLGWHETSELLKSISINSVQN